VATVDVTSLLCFWYATGGVVWTNNSGWLVSGTSECTWKGVTCDSTNTIISLDLAGNGLTGSIPPEIKLVKNLQGLMLSGNSIGGELPVSLSEMSELVDLNQAAVFAEDGTTVTGVKYSNLIGVAMKAIKEQQVQIDQQQEQSDKLESELLALKEAVAL